MLHGVLPRVGTEHTSFSMLFRACSAVFVVGCKAVSVSWSILSPALTYMLRLLLFVYLYLYQCMCVCKFVFIASLSHYVQLYL